MNKIKMNTNIKIISKCKFNIYQIIPLSHCQRIQSEFGYKFSS